jgi:putative ABC transport system substrate-binding protein
MRRFSAFALAWCVVLAAAAIATRAQTPGKTYRIALLSTDYRRLPDHPLLLELKQRGYVEGRNLVVDQRVGSVDRLPELARALAEAHPDVILAAGLPAARAAHAAIRTIPIIAVSSFPLEAALVDSLSRPGGNLSGVSIFTAELNPKRLALLHELVPTAHHVALLRDAPFAPTDHIAMLEATARDLGIAVTVLDVARSEEVVGSFRRAREGGADAVNVLASTLFASPGVRDILGAAARDAGLPTICQWREMAEAGCLASYGPDLAGIYRMAGAQIDRVLQGAPVADLPVEQPTRLELVINLKTAKALGLTIAPSLLARADEVIE